MIAPTLISIALILLDSVNGVLLHNITVGDSDPSITYTGAWNDGTGEPDSYGGGHRSSTQTGAYATFTFTGIELRVISAVSEYDFTKLGI